MQIIASKMEKNKKLAGAFIIIFYQRIDWNTKNYKKINLQHKVCSAQCAKVSSHTLPYNTKKTAGKYDGENQRSPWPGTNQPEGNG